jgi:hypothetical protein
MNVKSFPNDYSDKLVNIINLMSFSNGSNVNIVGTMSLKSQKYASDVDCYEVVKMKSIQEIELKIKQIINNLSNTNNVIIADLKLGNIDKFLIFKDSIEISEKSVKGFNSEKALKKLENLYKLKIINPVDYAQIKNKLEHFNFTPKELFDLKEDLKSHVLRWKPDDIKRGFISLPNGHRVFLMEALNTDATHKLDVIAYLDGRYVEITMMYEMHVKNHVINPPKKNILVSIKQDVLSCLLNNQLFKMAKRIFSLARLTKQKQNIIDLSNMFNSDLGKFYSISSDIKTLLFLLENVHNISRDKIKHEISQFKNRLSDITLPKWYEDKPQVMEIINQLVKSKQSPYQTELFITQLNVLLEVIENMLSYYAKKSLKKIGLFPVPTRYLP